MDVKRHHEKARGWPGVDAVKLAPGVSFTGFDTGPLQIMVKIADQVNVFVTVIF